MKFCFSTLLAAVSLCGQQAAPQPQKESIIVTGTAEPVPLSEADRDVNLIPLPEKQRPLYESWFDLLNLDPALDLQQAVPGGFESDLSIRGATFGQTLVLLNGLRVNDVQTGHFNLDLPVPLEMISDLQMLKGAGSTLYGSDAIGGVVNARTEAFEPGELRLLGGAGNFGFNQEHAIAAFGQSWWQEELAFARDFSSGFMPDRDYRNLALSSLSTLKSPLGATSLLFAYSDRPFGANDFYGAPQQQWERTKTWFASAHQDLGKNTEANFAFRKHTDLYVYIRSDPAFYTNHHLEQDWQGNLRRHDRLPFHGVLSYGVEGLAESIQSTNLGVHSRTRGSGYLFYDLRTARRFSLSAGIREEIYGAREIATSPSLSAAVWLSGRFKLRGSASHAFRLPSYTDIYYSSPSTIGNTNLKPETANSYEGGLDAYLKNDVHASVTVFRRRDSNVIDYVLPAGTSVFAAQNLPPLDFTGVETGVIYDPLPTQHIAVSFSALHGQYASPQNLVTEYTFNYPVHYAIVEWRGTIVKNVIGRTRIGALNRAGANAYAIWDASATYATGHVRPFLQLTNITSTVYQDIPLVAEPKRGIVGGAEIYLWGASR